MPRFKKKIFKPRTDIPFWMGTLYCGNVHEERIYQEIKEHSRLIDRINLRRMYLMTTWIRDAFNIDDPEIQKQLSEKGWKFYGKKSGGKNRFI